MPTLQQYILGRLAQSEYSASDVELVLWDTGVELADGTTWVPAIGFAAAASQVDVREVSDGAKSRIRFQMKDGAVFQWWSGDFRRIDLARPKTITTTDLTT